MHRFSSIVSVAAVAAVAALAAVALVGVISISGAPAPADGSGGSVTGLSFDAVEGSSFAGNVATFVDPGCSATYSATISWGDGQMSSGAITYNGTCAAGYDVVSSHTYAEEGTYHTSISVSGTDGFSGTGTGTATVSDAAISLSPLTVTFTAAKSFDENVAVLRDADPAGVASDYGSTINWGDGHTSAGVVNAAAEGAFDIAGQHTYSTAGLHTIHVTAKDAGGASAKVKTYAGSLVVHGLSISAQHGVTFAGNVATFVDPLCTAGDFSVSIDWGDGQKSSGAITSNGNCAAGYNVLSSHTYANEGTLKTVVKVTASNGEGGKGKGKAIVS